MSYRKLWIALVLVLVISFAVLGGVGIKVMNNAPPIPSRVVTSDGRTLFDGATILDGQNAWHNTHDVTARERCCPLAMDAASVGMMIDELGAWYFVCRICSLRT